MIELNSTTDLVPVANQLLALASDCPVWCFKGEMGAGKTTLIKAICDQLHVQDTMSSPTFSIVNEYRTSEGEPIYHFDFYRIEEEQEALDIGTLEYFDSGNLCLIEWPAKIPNLLPEHYLIVTITASASGQRTITLKTT